VNTIIDRRIADRRRSVKEDGARRRLRRMLVLLFLVGLGGLGGWMVYHSSYLAVDDISIDGQVESRADAILVEHGVVVGVPTINVRDDAIQAALVEDPWIAAASVRVTWPGSVTVQIVEHVPVGWVEADDQWLLATVSGTVLEVAAEPPEGVPLISVGSIPVGFGVEVDAAAVAALEFVDELPEELAVDALVMGNAEELTGVVAGHHLVLGYPADMAGKAAAFVAVLESGVSDGAEINVVSPERPAVMPQLEVETSAEVVGESQPSG
jgi:cell division protein FtsQ